MSLTQEIAEALADQLTPISPSQEIQVVAARMLKPTPPCIDIYPDTPFLEAAGFGRQSVCFRFIVRTRVAGNDLDAQTDLLYEFMDPFAGLSIRGALLEDQTLGGIADMRVLDEEISGVVPYQDTPDGPVLPGFTIPLRIYNRDAGAS